MKVKILFIVLIISQLNSMLIGQNDPEEPTTKIGLILDDTSDPESHEHSEISIPFWSNFEFTNKNGYSVLIFNDGEAEDLLYKVSDVEILNAIQTKYNNSTSVFNNHCKSEEKSIILLVKDKQSIESAIFYKDCNILETKSGPINFNPDILLSSFEAIRYEEAEKLFAVKDTLDNFRENATSNNNILIIDKGYDFSCEFQFIYQGGVDKLNHLQEDELYSNLAKEKIVDQKSTFWTGRKSKLAEKGLLIELLLRSQFKRSDFDLLAWSISKENPQDFIINAITSKEDLNLDSENIIMQKEKLEYKQFYLKIKL